MKPLFHKKSMEKVQLVVLLFILASIIILSGFALKFNLFASEEATITKCRLSMIANSKIRGDIITSSAKEKIPVNCPMRPDLIIKKSDIDANSPAAMKYNIMRIIADEQVITHFKTAADLNISPLSENDGIYCVVDRKISFDKAIKQDSDLDKINNYFSYLMNTKKPKSAQYYSEYLYDFRKETADDVSLAQLAQTVIDASTADAKMKEELKNANLENIDFNIDTDKDYYSVHVIIKGSTFTTKYAKADPYGTTSRFCGAAAGFLGGLVAGMLMVPDFTVSKAVALVGIGIISACGGSAAMSMKRYGADNDYRRVTRLIAADDFADLGCTETFK
jgi:hypothetical protein